jgi:hypothetical protein
LQHIRYPPLPNAPDNERWEGGREKKERTEEEVSEEERKSKFLPSFLFSTRRCKIG